MTALTWSEALALQQPRMDQTHREFIELLQLLEQSIGLDAATLDERFVALVRATSLAERVILLGEAHRVLA